MTDRINALTVVLTDDWREDDVQSIIEAIKLLRGVLRVSPKVADLDNYVAEERAKHELVVKIRELLA